MADMARRRLLAHPSGNCLRLGVGYDLIGVFTHAMGWPFALQASWQCRTASVSRTSEAPEDAARRNHASTQLGPVSPPTLTML